MANSSPTHLIVAAMDHGGGEHPETLTQHGAAGSSVRSTEKEGGRKDRTMPVCFFNDLAIQNSKLKVEATFMSRAQEQALSTSQSPLLPGKVGHTTSPHLTILTSTSVLSTNSVLGLGLGTNTEG